MLRRRVWLLRCFTFLTAGVIACWTGSSEAYEPWKGQVTVRVKVRQAPVRTSPAITQIDQGVEVTISDEREGWYKVVVEEDSFGFIGWVYGKYVRNPNDPVPTASPPPEVPEECRIPSSKPTTAPNTHAAPTAINRPPNDRMGNGEKSNEVLEKSTHVEDKPAPVVRQKEMPSAPQAEMAGDRFQHAPQHKSVEKKEADQPEIGKAKPVNRPAADEVTLQEGSPDVEKRHVSTREPPPGAVALSQAAPLQNEAVLPVKELSGPPTKSVPAVGIPQEKAPAETEAAAGHNSKRDPGWGVVMGVVVKLVVVAFSCLALILAYRAWLMTSARNKR